MGFQQLRLRRRPWREETCWALDLELTGLDPARDHILSLAMVPLRGGAIRLGDRIDTYVRSDLTSSGSALLVHGIAPSDVRDAPPLGDVLAEVVDRLDGAVLVVHHAGVDVRFLQRACRDTGVRWPRPVVIDTLALTRRLARNAEVTGAASPPEGDLAAIREHLGLPRHRAHRALDDAVATAELFLALASRLDATRIGELA